MPVLVCDVVLIHMRCVNRACCAVEFRLVRGLVMFLVSGTGRMERLTAAEEGPMIRFNSQYCTQ